MAHKQNYLLILWLTHWYPVAVCFMEDLGAIGDYSGSPFLSFGSDLLLDLSVEDDIGNWLGFRL